MTYINFVVCDNTLFIAYYATISEIYQGDFVYCFFLITKVI